MFLIPMVMEILLPCYYGHDLATASSKLLHTMLHSQWYNSNCDLKAVKIFMENTKRNIDITAFEFFKVDLETFGSICIIAYRLFAVLNNVNK